MKRGQLHDNGKGVIPDGDLLQPLVFRRTEDVSGVHADAPKETQNCGTSYRRFWCMHAHGFDTQTRRSGVIDW